MCRRCGGGGGGGGGGESESLASTMVGVIILVVVAASCTRPSGRVRPQEAVVLLGIRGCSSLTA